MQILEQKLHQKKVSILGVNLNHQIGEIKYILSAQRTFSYRTQLIVFYLHEVYLRTDQ